MHWSRETSAGWNKMGCLSSASDTRKRWVRVWRRAWELARLVCGHLRLAGLALQREDGHGVAGQLGAQRHALPVLAACAVGAIALGFRALPSYHVLKPSQVQTTHQVVKSVCEGRPRCCAPKALLCGARGPLARALAPPERAQVKQVPDPQHLDASLTHDCMLRSATVQARSCGTWPRTYSIPYTTKRIRWMGCIHPHQML